MKIVCMGDSLTYGYGVRHQDSWIRLVRDMKPEYMILNRGIPGDTTGGMLSRFETDVLANEPDLVFLMGGTNDIFFAESIIPARSNIAAMVSICMARNIKMILGIPIPICREALTDEWRYYAELPNTQKLYDELTGWIEKYGKQFVIPILAMEKILPDDETRRKECYLDGVHLNEKGNRLMAEYFVSQISDME